MVGLKLRVFRVSVQKTHPNFQHGQLASVSLSAMVHKSLRPSTSEARATWQVQHIAQVAIPAAVAAWFIGRAAWRKYKQTSVSQDLKTQRMMNSIRGT